MNITDLANYSAQEALKIMHTSLENGLSDKEVLERQARHGLNTLPRSGRAWWNILLQQFSSSFVHLLLIAAGLSFFLQNHLSGIMIALLTLATTLMGFYQEYYAEKTVQLLMHYLATQSHVCRNGKEIIVNSEQLVPGDILFLSAGNGIPADVRFIQSQGLLVDESTLSGESVPVSKSSDITNVERSYFVPNTIGLCGSVIVNGKATAAVIATGGATKFSALAKLGSEIDRPSMFLSQIAKLSRIIAILVVITLIIIYLAHLLSTGRVLSVVDLSLFMIALAVSIVPQAMQAVITFALSRGARVMASKDVIVKRLASIEDLGSVTMLCVDKTGTITENRMTVDDIFASDHDKVILYALCTGEGIIDNGPLTAFDSALQLYARNEILHAIKTINIVATIPFKSKNRSNGAVVVHDKSHECILRGAYQDVLNQCTQSSEVDIGVAHDWAGSQENEGKRVIAVAAKPIESYDQDDNLLDEFGFTFLGMISFIDPIKPSAYEALKEAQLLGVTIKIITGDAPNVAAHVAKQIGLINSDDQVMTGDTFEKLSPLEQEEACAKVAVFARTLSEQKFDIITILKKTEHVAFLGEGVNDVPSLKNSLVGLVVENAADIAKDAADIVLLKRNLLVIVDGIQEGRKIFTNTHTYFQGMLTSNFSRFYAIAFASFFIDFLPMLPLQILLVNFLSDLPLIFIATDNVDPDELEKPRVYQVKELISFGMILGGLCFCIDLIFFVQFRHVQPAILRTNWFIITVLTELIFFYLIRTKRLAFTVVQPSRILIVMALLSALITMVLPYTNIGQSFFGLAALDSKNLAWIAGFLVVYLIIMECGKLMYYRYFGIVRQKN